MYVCVIVYRRISDKKQLNSIHQRPLGVTESGRVQSERDTGTRTFKQVTDSPSKGLREALKRQQGQQVGEECISVF